jgi:hypothetical protein
MQQLRFISFAELVERASIADNGASVGHHFTDLQSSLSVLGLPKVQN